MKTIPLGTELLRQRRSAKSAAAGRDLRVIRGMVPEATVDWPQRPSAKILSERIPLFFIGRDPDGFWLARHADSPIGGLFLRRRSAMNFAKRACAPIPCATMVLAEPHRLDTENRGNRLAPRLRPAMRLARRLTASSSAFAATLFAKARAVGDRLSRAYIEDRMLRAALEVDFYRGRYKHSNKNDDDLPIVGS
jgi:hypothetical protein